ncbi:threonine/serine exporter family protein [Rothia sp. L_38]|uniref:threonine/serine exporter family protein n=1 Tax=Rothia sp. L_38 TaxID=3422315 RepID=UPI003D6BCA62
MTANGGFRSFAQPQQALTVPIRGLARVAQRQVAQVALARYRQRIRQKEETHEILAFALRLAETMFHYGADAADVDTAVVTVCAMYGIHDVEVDITYQSIVINYVSEFDEAAERGQLPEAGGLGVEKLGRPWCGWCGQPLRIT